MSRLVVAIFCVGLLAHGVQAASSGGGLKLGGGEKAPAFADGKVRGFPVQAFEPWVKTAKVGDFIVIKRRDGKTERKEVKSIDADCVVVDSETTGRPIYEMKYSRKEAPAQPRELDLKKTGVESVELNGKKFACDVYEGFTVGSYLGGLGKSKQSFKALRYKKLVAADVPFGGTVKEFKAPDDGVPLRGGAGRVNNKIEQVQLEFEVTDFGNANDK